MVLVTHTVHRLAYADHIIILSPDGSITEQGTLEKLKVAGGYVTDLEARYRAASNPEKVNKPLILEKSAVGSTNVMEENVDNELNAAEKDLSRRGGDFSLYSYYLSSAHSVSALIWASCFMIFGISSKLSELLVKFWTAATEKHGNAVDSLYLGLYGMLAILTTAGLVGGLYHYILYFAPKSAQVLHERLVKSVMNAPLSFFASVDSGTTLNRFSQDMTLVDTDLPYALTDFILSVSTGLMSAIIMCISARYFAATMPLVFLLMWLLQKFYLRTSRQMRLLDLEFKSPLFSQFTETLSGLATIRAFGWTPTFKTQHQVLLDVSQKPFYLLFCIQRWLELTLDFIVTGLCLILMVMIVKLRSEIGASYVGLAILNVITFSQSLSTILRNWTSLETSIGAIARIREFVQTTENENQAVENVPLPCSGGGGNSTLWPPSGAIKFYNVSASYHPGKGKDRNLAIRNINMSIQAGEKIGICGRSGSGKSSLLATLFRMIEVEPGSQILIDGIDITRTPRQQLRTALNAIPQEPFTTYATVRANADPLGTHTNNEIEEALRSVELWETVQSKGGLDAKLDSCFFSHGQKQLFCLARGLLRGGKVIVLDEITSNVDVVSDALMQRIIRDKFVDCTVLAVAHRLDTILDFDRVAVMRGGELIELDNPQSLLLSRESAFKELYESR